MDGIEGLRIRKRSFSFGIKHKYSPELKFRKVEKTVGERLLESISALSKPKEKVVLEGAQEAKEGLEEESNNNNHKPAPKPLISPRNVRRIGGAIFLLLLLSASGIIYFQSMVSAAEIVVNPPVTSFVSAEVTAQDLLTASKEGFWRQPYHSAYLRLDAEAGGIDELPVTVNVYDRVVPSSVYLLRSYRYQAENYPQFISVLRANLSRWGISINEVGLDELGSLPSQSLVIVPSGYIPSEMLIGSDTKISALLQRGVTVIYMGQPFNRMYSTEGSVVPGNTGYLSPLLLRFEEGVSLPTTSGFHLKSPLYSVGDIRVMGSASVAYFGTGAMVFLPQTLDGGWSSPEFAADDVQKLILELPWLSPISTDSGNLSFVNGSATSEYFTTSFLGDGVYAHLQAYDNATGNGFNEVVYLEKSTRGEIYTLGHSISPSAIGSTQMDVVVELKEAGGEERLFFSVVQDLLEVGREPVSSSKLALNSDATFSYTFSLSPGDYILNIVDNDGRRYARAYMRAGDVSIVSGYSRYSNDQYEFKFYADGKPLSLTGDVFLEGYSTPTHFENAQSVVVDAATVAGGPLAVNEDHEFRFEIKEYETTVTIRKRGTTSILTSPFLLGAVGIAVLALGVGFLFARKGVAMYGLDIPDFPPQSTIKVPLSKEKLLGVFTKINERYRWKNTPLKLSEIKLGFKDLLHEGKPIFISDYNLEYLLSRLVGMDLVKREIDYYGLSSWEGETGKSIRYLASFRKLRDICINNAVPFTAMGKGKDYDSKITVLGQDIFVHLYDDASRVIPNALSSLQNGMNIVLFEEEAEKSEFYEYLSSGYRGATALKLEVQAGSILMKTWEEFAQMIKEMKV
ncbi:hypothetical protein JW721_03560 [Candidatus Micrarchaeota archaeon]|nr:hypothetical protein [Candidatus Micrarchaeota archaeon]